MKIVGLVTEYNPFHSGHRYHIEQAKKITGADYCIAVMSGDFVQRGAPAFMPKHLRTEMALDGGCDLVLELPACFATGSAEYFASGAIAILDKLNCIDSICFGSECGDYSSLETIAEVLVNEPKEYKICLQKNLKEGLNYPLARQNALATYFRDEKLLQIVNEPNNILGIEYIKAMISKNSSMKGYTITRQGASYHTSSLSEQYSSASAIRKYLSNKPVPDFEALNNQVSARAVEILKSNYNHRYPVETDDLSLLLKYKLLSETKDSLSEYMDIDIDLANRIINKRNQFITISQFIDIIKTKDLTYSRISRSLMHILLNIKDIHSFDDIYARVLGFKKDSNELFSIIKKYSEIPLITKLTSLESLNNTQKKMLSQDIFASDLYESIISNKFSKPFINELTKQIIKL